MTDEQFKNLIATINTAVNVIAFVICVVGFIIMVTIANHK